MMTPYDTTSAFAGGRGGRAFNVSFEFFPPKTPAMADNLWQTIDRLAPLAPNFVSVTYGAGGGTRERTHAVVERILAETSLVPAAHLTCVGAACEEIDAVATRYWQSGVRHIVALRGDPPEGESSFKPHRQGYDGSVALIEGLRRIGYAEVSAGAYPEPHPESRGPKADLDYLKRKVDAGATRLISQFFFDNSAFLRQRDLLADAGLAVPLVPGILPVTNFRQVVKFSSACGATIPPWMSWRFEGLDDEPATRRLVAAVTSAEQCLGLAREGVDSFHFYTLNRAELTYAICHMLGVRTISASAETDK